MGPLLLMDDNFLQQPTRLLALLSEQQETPVMGLAAVQAAGGS
ncbi:MAG: hypothetical protein AAF703_08070 [Cyanobacteria bacterium P01_D01_bin.105]